MLSGTAATGSGGTYPLTITANNGVGSEATQTFTLTVHEAPAFTSANATTFSVGSAGSFNLAAQGFPAPTFSTSSTLPNGITLSAAGVLSGTPASGTGGNYSLTFTASNGVGSAATQNFTLTVNKRPRSRARDARRLSSATRGNFALSASGFPAPMFNTTGPLPNGVSLERSWAC